MGFSIRLFFPTGILVRLFGLFLFQKFQAIPLIGEAGKLLIILVKTVTRQDEGEAFYYSKKRHLIPP
jgi:hypothetical protein